MQSPSRGIGATSLAKLAEMAQHAGLPLARAAESMSLLKQLQPRVANALGAFTDIVRGRAPTPRGCRRPNWCAGSEVGTGRRAAQACRSGLFRLRRGSLDELADWFEGATISGPGELAAQLALLSHADKGDPGNQVRLMSLHAAKGLEFRYVFIVGMDDSTLPHESSLDEGRLDEERRLLYVGITRAKEQLWLSYSREAQRWGTKVRLVPSRFFDELPAAELQRDGADPEADAARRAERASAGFASTRAARAEPSARGRPGTATLRPRQERPMRKPLVSTVLLAALTSPDALPRRA